MKLKFRLIIMNFLQFYVWGSWLITLANYWFGTKGWGPTDFGAVFLTLGISSMFMPTLTGIIADRWINAEKLYAILHLLAGATVFCFPLIDSPSAFFWIMLLAMTFYMPTIALTNTVGYNALKQEGYDVIKDFPPIRVWGTIGFIAAMWVTNLSGNKATEMQFYFSSIAAVILGIYSFTLPKCPPQNKAEKGASFVKMLGLDAFKLLANYKMAIFFIFSMLLGASLQLTNMYGDVFLDEFKHFAIFENSFVVKYSTIVMSISQISETLFILTIPFFLKRFGIKKVMIMSMIAWVLRFTLFGFGDPITGLWMIILSMIVYGMAFDFFNISGALFVETQCEPSMRASGQGLFMMMTNGLGTIIGAFGSGVIIEKYFTLKFTTLQEVADYFGYQADNSLIEKFHLAVTDAGILETPYLVKEWSDIWLTFAAYALVVAVLFAILFKHKHDPKEVENVSH